MSTVRKRTFGPVIAAVALVFAAFTPTAVFAAEPTNDEGVEENATLTTEEYRALAVSDPSVNLPGIEGTYEFGPLVEDLKHYRAQGISVQIVQDAATGELVSVEPRGAESGEIAPAIVQVGCTGSISACWYGYPLVTGIAYGFWGVGNDTGSWANRGSFEMYAGVGQACYVEPSTGKPFCTPLLLAGDGWAPGGAPVGVLGTDVVLV